MESRPLRSCSEFRLPERRDVPICVLWWSCGEVGDHVAANTGNSTRLDADESAVAGLTRCRLIHCANTATSSVACSRAAKSCSLLERFSTR